MASEAKETVAEMIHLAREHGDTEFVSAVMDALNDEIGVIRDRLQAEIDDNRQRAETAEARAADIETRTAVKLGEFAKLTDIIDAECKRLGIQWHGSVSTTLKAVIEAATRRGRILDAVRMFEKGLNDAATAAQPAKPETGKADTIVEIDGKRYRREAVARLPKQGELYLDDCCGLGVIPAHFDFEKDPQHILHELTDEHAPPPHVETGGQDWQVQDLGVGNICITFNGKCLTREQAESAAAWLNRRGEVEAQLAQFKQQAEAWEAVRKWQMDVKACGSGWWAVIDKIGHRFDGAEGDTEDSPIEAVLSLASQLSASQADQKGDG